MEEKEVLPGQLRRWKNSFNDHHLAGRTFLILQEDWERCETEPCWSFLIDGREDWHFNESIILNSEVLDGTVSGTDSQEL